MMGSCRESAELEERRNGSSLNIYNAISYRESLVTFRLWEMGFRGEKNSTLTKARNSFWALWTVITES